MTLLRKLEIGCGAATGLLGIATAANMMSADLEVMRRLGRDFPVAQELLVASAMYVLPGLLVAIGSYVHALRLRTWGLTMVIVTSVGPGVVDSSNSGANSRNQSLLFHEGLHGFTGRVDSDLQNALGISGGSYRNIIDYIKENSF